jgi:hypothetical protein
LGFEKVPDTPGYASSIAAWRIARRRPRRSLKLWAENYGCFFCLPIRHRNPDELVWKHLTADTVGRSAIQSYADFKGKMKSSMHSLQRNTKKIRSFFAKDTLRYAA